MLQSNKLGRLTLTIFLLILITGCSNVNNVNSLSIHNGNKNTAVGNQKEDENVIVYKPEDSEKRDKLFGSRLSIENSRNLKAVKQDDDVDIILTLFVRRQKYMQFINEIISNYTYNVNGFVKDADHTDSYANAYMLSYVINVPAESPFVDDFSPQIEQYLVDQGVELYFKRRIKFIENN